MDPSSIEEERTWDCCRNVTRLASKNSGKIKEMAEDNADKITDTVGKVTAKIDEKTGGKHSDTLKKVEDAVDKALNHDDEPADDDPAADEPDHPTDPAEPGS